MALVGNDLYFSVSAQTQLQCAFVTGIYLTILSDLVCLIVVCHCQLSLTCLELCMVVPLSGVAGCPVASCCPLLTCCPVLPIATSLFSIVPLRFLCLATECKPCTKPGHICDPNTGECICPPNTEGPRCERCVTDAYDFNNTKGCKVGAERCGSW